MRQEQIHGAGAGSSRSEDSFTPGQSQVSVQSIDALLDEIDAVVEVNAAEFVQGFVQKGGQ